MARDLDKGMEKEIFRSTDSPLIPRGSQAHSLYGAGCLPDGKRIAMILLRNSPDSALDEAILKIMPVGGGEAYDLHRFEGAGGTGPMGWASDGKFLFSCVTVRDHSNSRLWRVSVDSGEAVNLGLEMSRIYEMSVHPDGKQIAFSSKGPTAQIPELWVMENFLPIDKKVP